MQVKKFELNNQGRFSYVVVEDCPTARFDALDMLTQSGWSFSPNAIEAALEEAREATGKLDCENMHAWLRNMYGSLQEAYLAHTPHMTLTEVAA